MKCETCQAALIHHAHDELEHPERVAIAQHLATCPDCALEYCRLRADLDGIAQAYADSPRPEVARALRNRVAAEFAPPWWRRLAAVAARPIPAYGVAFAGLVPVGIWLAVNALQPADPGAGVGQRPARITDYDASTVRLSDRDLL